MINVQYAMIQQIYFFPYSRLQRTSCLVKHKDFKIFNVLLEYTEYTFVLFNYIFTCFIFCVFNIYIYI